MNDYVRNRYLYGLEMLARLGTTVEIRTLYRDFADRFWSSKPNYRALPETLRPRFRIAVTLLKQAFSAAHPDHKESDADNFAMSQVKYFYDRFMGVQNNLLLEHMIGCLNCHSTSDQARASLGLLGLSEGVLFDAIVLYALNTLNVELTDYKKAE